MWQHALVISIIALIVLLFKPFRDRMIDSMKREEVLDSMYSTFVIVFIANIYALCLGQELSFCDFHKVMSIVLFFILIFLLVVNKLKHYYESKG